MYNQTTQSNSLLNPMATPLFPSELCPEKEAAEIQVSDLLQAEIVSAQQAQNKLGELLRQGELGRMMPFKEVSRVNEPININQLSRSTFVWWISITSPESRYQSVHGHAVKQAFINLKKIFRNPKTSRSKISGALWPSIKAKGETTVLLWANKPQFAPNATMYELGSRWAWLALWYQHRFAQLVKKQHLIQGAL
jgi:hypothetical protein